MSSRRELRLTYADGKCLRSLLRNMNQSWKIMEAAARLSCEFLHQGTAISKTNWVSTSNMINCKISKYLDGNMSSTTCFSIDEQNCMVETSKLAYGWSASESASGCATLRSLEVGEDDAPQWHSQTLDDSSRFTSIISSIWCHLILHVWAYQTYQIISVYHSI